MSGGLKHPFGGALYIAMSDGTVRVEHEGAWGLFQHDGQWIEGEIREADPQFCGWVAAPQAQRREWATLSAVPQGARPR
jgi:hypothetical protein